MVNGRAPPRSYTFYGQVQSVFISPWVFLSLNTSQEEAWCLKQESNKSQWLLPFWVLPPLASRFILNLVDKVEILVSAIETEKQGNKLKNYVYELRLAIQSKLWLFLNQRPSFIILMRRAKLHYHLLVFPTMISDKLMWKLCKLLRMSMLFIGSVTGKIPGELVVS